MAKEQRMVVCEGCGELKFYAAKDRCRPCYQKLKYENNKDAYKSANLVRQYGITIEEYKEQLAIQNGRCAVCGCEPRKKFSFSVDHDHDTGAVRGLLCIACNFMLGHSKDNTETLRAGIEYLEKGGVWNGK